MSAQSIEAHSCYIIFCMRRYGMTIRLRPEAEAAYRQHHQAVWPAVLNTITACNMRNYTIFLRDGCLFGYFEYIGQDYAADMRKMAADPATQKWWAVMEPMQEPFPNQAEGEWWSLMEEVFHHD
jgi:L-rhamnose mutarotase